MELLWIAINVSYVKKKLNTQYMLQLVANSINVVSLLRNTGISAESGSAVHLVCRKRFIHEKDIQYNKRKSSITATEEQALLSS